MKEGLTDLLLAIYEANEAARNLGSVPDEPIYDQIRERCELEVINVATEVRAALNILVATNSDPQIDSSVEVNLYVDGACSGNPGVGGWAFRIETNNTFIEGSGYTPQATNNQMEIMSAIKGLEAIKEVSPKLRFRPTKVNVYSDSEYLIRTMKNEYKKKKNLNWWDELDHARKDLNVEWFYVAGHSGHEQNERVDALAKEAIKNKSGISGG